MASFCCDINNATRSSSTFRRRDTHPAARCFLVRRLTPQHSTDPPCERSTVPASVVPVKETTALKWASQATRRGEGCPARAPG